MYIRRRTNECGRLKRTNRKTKSSDSAHFLFGTPLKLLLIWSVILLLDFFIEFRVELFYSCGMFSYTLVDSFRFQGIAFTIYFVLITVILDVLCYLFLPTTMIYLIGSSLVWIQLIWHTDRGLSSSTFVLCFVLVYVEIAVRWRASNILFWGVDIGYPFAAHCVGYQAATLGFVLQNMIAHHLRIRKQRSVEAQNRTFFAMLEDALPKEIRQYFKFDENAPDSKRPSVPTLGSELSLSLPNSNEAGNDGRLINGPKYNRNVPNSAPPSGRKQQFNQKNSTQPTSALPDLLHKKDSCQLEPDLDNGDNASKSADTSDAVNPNASLLPDESSLTVQPTTSLDSHRKAVAIIGGDAVKSSNNAESSSPTDKSSAPVGSMSSNGAQNRSSVVGVFGGSGGVGGSSGAGGSGGGGRQGPNSNPKNANKDEYTLKLEAEAKELKAELQSLRALEIDLRAQVQQFIVSERTHRSEASQAQQECETLQSKLDQLTQRSETDRANLEDAEKHLADERKLHVVLENRLAALQQQQQQQEQSKINASSCNIADPQHDEQLPINKNTKSNNHRSTHVTNATVGSPTVSYVPTIATTNSSPSSCACVGAESCTLRIRELESEWRSLNRELSVKELQLATIKESRSAAARSVDRTNCTSPAQDQMNALLVEDSRSELLSMLTRLQDENDRMSNTLRDEDKMKQELMTAYHSSLKEITELNASLTNKEFQIVELNMRLEVLTSQFCERVNTLPNARKYNNSADSRSMLLDNDLGNQAVRLAPYLAMCPPDAVKPPSSNRRFKSAMMLVDGSRPTDARGSYSNYNPVNGSIQPSVTSCMNDSSGLFEPIGPSTHGSTLQLLDPSMSSNGPHPVFSHQSAGFYSTTEPAHHPFGSMDQSSYTRQSSSSSQPLTSTRAHESIPTRLGSLYDTSASTNTQYSPLFVSPNIGYLEPGSRSLQMGSSVSHSSPSSNIETSVGLLHSSLSPGLASPTLPPISLNTLSFSSHPTTSTFDILASRPLHTTQPTTNYGVDTIAQTNSAINNFFDYLSPVNSTLPPVSMFTTAASATHHHRRRPFTTEQCDQPGLIRPLSVNYSVASDSELSVRQRTDQDMIELTALEASLLQTNGAVASNHQSTTLVPQSLFGGDQMRINNPEEDLFDIGQI